MRRTLLTRLTLVDLKANLSSETHEVPVVVVPEGVSSAKTSPVSLHLKLGLPELDLTNRDGLLGLIRSVGIVA